VVPLDTEKQMKAAVKEHRPLLGVEEAANYLGVSTRYVRRLRSERRIPAIKLGAKVRFDPDDLDALVEAGRETLPTLGGWIR
jgi:excisionase family DNA binding protein